MSLLRRLFIRGSAKGTTTEGDVTSTNQGSSRQGLDVQIRKDDGTAVNDFATQTTLSEVKQNQTNGTQTTQLRNSSNEEIGTIAKPLYTNIANPITGYATEATQVDNKSLLTDIKALFTNTYNQVTNWFAVKVIDTVSVTGIVSSNVSDKVDFKVPTSTTLLIEDDKIKTFPVYSPWFIIDGTLENNGICNFSSVGEVQINGTIINNGLIIYS